MNLIRNSLAAVILGGSALLAHAEADPYERCNSMYPSETYGAEERESYIQECVQSANANDASANASAQPEPPVETEPPAYDGTVEQYIGEQSTPSE